MFNPDNLLDSDLDLHQKRSFLSNPKNNQVHLVTNSIIYCSQYYPFTKSLLHQISQQINNKSLLLEALSHLYQCLQRQIVTGPSSSFIPPSLIPIYAKQDNSFYQKNKKQHISQQQAIKILKQLNITVFQKAQSELLWYNCSQFLSLKSVQQFQCYYKYYLKQLQIDGQNWLQSTPFPSLFLVCQTLIEKIQHQTWNAQQKLKVLLLRGRINFLHNKILKNPVKKLCEIVLDSYRQAIKVSNKICGLQQYVQYLLQFSFPLLFYYKYSQSQKILDHCSNLLKMRIQFTGKLGRRTKYQSFDTAQLIMNLVDIQKKQQIKQQKYHQQQYEQQQKIDLIDAKQLVKKQRLISISGLKSQIKQSQFDQQSILLQKPNLTEQNNQQAKLKQVGRIQLLVSLAVIYEQWRSTPHDQMLYLSISAALTTLLSYKVQTSYSYNFSLFLLRSQNQFPRIKHTQRAIDQLQKLKVSYNNRDSKNIIDIHSTPYQTHLGFVLILADKFIQMGLSLTAVSLFQQAGLYQQCVQGLIRKGYKQKALQTLEKLIQQNGKNPRILCMLGDIHSQSKYYQQAWQLSGSTCARAQRALGWIHFNKNQYELAAQCFLKATQASYYHPSTWFTLGCSLMRSNKMQKALKAFSQCISIDQTQGQAWGNMASCYLYLKKHKQAFSTLQQAVKYSSSNWKLWANLLSVSLSLKQFYKYFECMEKIIQLGHSDALVDEHYQKIIKILNYQIQTANKKRIVFNFKNRIDRLYNYLIQKIGQLPIVWKSKCQYACELLNYIQSIKQHFQKLHKQGKYDPNDWVPGYDTLQNVDKTTSQQLTNNKKNIVQYKQTELNMTMKVGWHDNKQNIFYQGYSVIKQKMYFSNMCKYIKNIQQKAMRKILNYLQRELFKKYQHVYNKIQNQSWDGCDYIYISMCLNSKEQINKGSVINSNIFNFTLPSKTTNVRPINPDKFTFLKTNLLPSNILNQIPELRLIQNNNQDAYINRDNQLIQHSKLKQQQKQKIGRVYTLSKSRSEQHFLKNQKNQAKIQQQYYEIQQMRQEMKDKARTIMSKKQDAAYLGRNLLEDDSRPSDKKSKIQGIKLLMKQNGKSKKSNRVNYVQDVTNLSMNTSSQSLYSSNDETRLSNNTQKQLKNHQQSRRQKIVTKNIKNSSYDKVLKEQRRRGAWQGFANSWNVGLLKVNPCQPLKKKSKKIKGQLNRQQEKKNNIIQFNDRLNRFNTLKKFNQAFIQTAVSYQVCCK